MTENMKAFLEYVSSNPEAFPTIKEMTAEEIIAAAKEKGFVLSSEDFKQQRAEIDDDDLEAVAGGGRCICSFGGGGKASEGEKNLRLRHGRRR